MMTSSRQRWLVLAITVVLLGSGANGWSQQALVRAPGAPLFAQPLLVEHHVAVVDGDGARWESQPVTDYYGGSWIASVRGDGSRLVVDFSRREITEIWSKRGTYSVLSFDRMAELRGKLAPQQSSESPEEAKDQASAVRGSSAREPTSLKIEEVRSAGIAGVASAAPRGDSLEGVTTRHLRVTRSGDTPDRESRGTLPVVDVWVDGRFTLPAAAVDALARLEGEVLGGAEGMGSELATMVSAARRHAGGAFAVRTVRSAGDAEGATAATITDEVSRIEALATFPQELVAVPEGCRRVPHPMELMAAFLAEEEARAAGADGMGR